MDKINTSITISTERKEKVLKAADRLGVSVSDILAALMRKTRAVYRQKTASVMKAVAYQGLSKEGKYKIWHVCLDSMCYEYGVSERLVFKVSVSLIYRIAIDRFLDEIVDSGLNAQVSTDDIATSYNIASYAVCYEESENKEFWTIFWDRRIKRGRAKGEKEQKP